MKKEIFILVIAGYYLCTTIKADDGIDGAAAVAVDIESEDSEETADTSDPFRIKRQNGHHNPFAGLLSSVFNKKLGLLGSLSSISSSSSSKGVDSHHHTYEYAPHTPAKPFDWWSFKKMILASLLQAVKAITGGVIALNGQLVKVKGHLLAAKGHLLSTKGDSITAFGRHLATNAFAQHQPAHSDIHEASIPAIPSVGSSGYPNSGFAIPATANIHGSLETGYPNEEFKSAIEYPRNNYFKESGEYSKRAVPSYVFIDNNTSNKNRK